MDIKTLLYNLREEVSCPVCSDIFKDPRQLHCLHSFCRHCLERWHQSSGGGNLLRCPKCQALNEVPSSGDLKDLPTSFYLNRFIDVLAIKECNSINVKCGNCETRSRESSYCFHCSKFYCEQCLLAHNVMRDNKDHRVLALKEFQDKDYEDVLKRPVFCSQQGHDKEELKYFCMECEEAACQTCVTLDHGAHTLKLIKEEAETQKLEMAALIRNQRENLQAKMRVVTKLDEDCAAKLIQEEKDIKSDVDKFADELIKTIQEKRQSIIAVVENEVQRSVENLTMKKNEIQLEMKTIESTLEEADKVLARSTSAELVRMKKSLDSILAGIVEAEPIVREPDILQTFVFLKNHKMLENVNGEELGFLEIPHRTKASESIAEGKGLKEVTVGRKAQFILTTRNAEKSQWYDKGDGVSVEVRDEQGQEYETKVLIDDKRDGVYHISYFPRVQGRFSLSVKVNGKHVRGSPFLVLVTPLEVNQCSLS